AAGAADQVDACVAPAARGEADGLLDLLPAVLDRLVVRLVQRLVRAVQADAAGVEPGVDQEREGFRERSIGVHVDRAASGPRAHRLDRLRDLTGAGERFPFASLAERDHGPPGRAGEVLRADAGHLLCAGCAEKSLVRGGRTVRRLLGDAADAARVAPRARRDGAFVALVERVLGG